MWEKYWEKVEWEMLLIQGPLLKLKFNNLRRTKGKEKDNMKNKWSKFTQKYLTDHYSLKEMVIKGKITKVGKSNLMKYNIKLETCNQEEETAKKNKEDMARIMWKIMKWSQIQLINTRKETSSKKSTTIWEGRPLNIHQKIILWKSQRMKVKVITMNKKILRANIYQKMEDTRIDQFLSLFL